MIKKKRLKEILLNINQLKKEEPFKLEVGILLNSFLLELGVKPKVIPNLTLYKVAQEYTDNVLNCDNIMLKNAYYNDLSLIYSLVEGVLNNYNAYKPKSKLYTLAESVLNTATCKFIDCIQNQIIR